MLEKTEPTHCPLQRVFTAKSSLLNTALIVVKTKRHFLILHVVALDAKSAFDVVNYRILIRQLYLCGVDDKHWNLIDSLQAGEVSAVNWDGNESDCFQIQQGGCQGACGVRTSLRCM